MDHFLQHEGVVNWKVQKKAWKTVWVAVIRCIWKHRNEIVFQQRQLNVQQVIDSIKFTSWSWLRDLNSDFNYSFYEWYVLPSMCFEGLN